MKQVRAELAQVTACIKIFEASGDAPDMPKYVDVYRLFKRGEAMITCKEALASGPVMESKGLDTGDKVLAKAVAAQLIHQLRMQANRGKVIRDGKKGTAVIWRLSDQQGKNAS